MAVNGGDTSITGLHGWQQTLSSQLDRRDGHGIDNQLPDKPMNHCKPISTAKPTNHCQIDQSAKGDVDIGKLLTLKPWAERRGAEEYD